MFCLAGSVRKVEIERAVKQSENPSGLSLTISDLDDKIRRLENERIRLQAIIDTFETGIYEGKIKIKNKGIGDLFGDREYNVGEIRSKMKDINAQLYGHFWETIWPICTMWDQSEWLAYNVRWDDRKAKTKGTEWAIEVQDNGWYKEGLYPYEEGYYMKRARVYKELMHVRSLSDRRGELSKPNWHAPIGNPKAVRDLSVPAP